MSAPPPDPRPNTIETYRGFWPYYLREHAHPLTRRIHIFGTGLGLAAFAAGVASANPWLAAAALGLGYGPAWCAHFFIEKNRPATFRYPIWSLASDFRMAGLWLTGNLGRELARAGIVPKRAAPSPAKRG